MSYLSPFRRRDFIFPNSACPGGNMLAFIPKPRYAHITSAFRPRLEGSEEPLTSLLSGFVF